MEHSGSVNIRCLVIYQQLLHTYVHAATRSSAGDNVLSWRSPSTVSGCSRLCTRATDH